MSLLDKTYPINLDLKKRTVNKIPSYYISDNETSDMTITLTNNGVPVNLENSIVLMVSVSPDKQRYYDFIDVRTAMDGVIYCNLKQHCKNADGVWIARLMIISNEEKLVTDTFTYKINTDEFVNADTDAQPDDRLPILTDMISRLSTIELNESSRQTAELSRVEAEKQRELIKQQFITDVNKLIADTNASVQTTLTQNTQKIDALVSDTTVKIDNYKTEKDLAISNDLAQYKNATTQDIEAYKTTKNAEIDAYKLQKDADIDIYVTGKNEELNLYVAGKNAELDTYVQNKDTELDTYVRDKNSTLDEAETIRVNAENVRVSSENTRVSNENARKTAEAARASAETTRVSSENTRVSNENARKTAETSRVTAENTRGTNETARVSAENTRKSNETARVSAESARVTAEANRVQQHSERESFMNGYDGRLTAVETTNTTQNERLTAVESSTTSHGSRLDKVEATTTNHGARLDKVEYQNKVQDTYIQGLFNENGDKRLNIEGGGNNLKLEGSSEGLAQVDSIVGNTSVNYCLNGNRELTLNGDIDASGTFVTTTEGVEGGLVDVSCEGNTLVNLANINTFEITGVHTGHTSSKLSNGYSYNIGTCANTIYAVYGLSNNLLKINTEYTIHFNIEGFTSESTCQIGEYNYINANNETLGIIRNGVNKFKFTYSETTKKIVFCSFNTTTNPNFKIINPIILEGDWTNKPIPPYFEGMKSVGQDDTNGHKIELVSRNKNLFDISKVKPSTQVEVVDNKIKLNAYACSLGFYCSDLGLKPGKTYKISSTLEITSGNSVEGATGHLRFMDRKDFNKWITSTTFVAPIDISDYLAYMYGTTGADETVCHISNIQLEEVPSIQSSSTTYTPHASNTKTISLTAPLRGLPNGVKDRFVKKDGKWYIERNCRKVVLNGSEGGWLKYNISSEGYFSACLDTDDAINTVGIHVVCDKFSSANAYGDLYFGKTETIYVGTRNTAKGGIIIGINNSKLSTQDVAGFKAWLQANPTTVIYELATPTYEPLDVTPELQTYLEQTHISNNSVIPCNMVVKNTGFNSIIKPSTLYTVIADTSGTGTFGVNLGGTKLTTATNKLTITTPATLTENMLRPYGKGLKGSKFRVLEGDCTGLDYPYFEGLRNTFDNVLVTQDMVTAGTEKAENLGKYKCNVKVRGKNLFSGELETGSFSYDGSIKIPLQGEIRNINPVKVRAGSILTFSALSTFLVWEYNKNMECVEQIPKTVIINTPLQLRNDTEYINFRVASPDLSQNIQIEEGTVATPYEPYYERNETVYLTSPLLKGDEIVVKDDGLYHYHKMIYKNNLHELNWIHMSMYEAYNSVVFNTSSIKDYPLNTNTINFNLISNNFMTGSYVVASNLHYSSCLMDNLKGLRIRIPKHVLTEITPQGLIQWLQANPTTVVYELAEPYYEKIADYPITLDIIPTSTLSVDSLIPCQTISTTYTGSVPSVYKIEETSVQNSADIVDTQIAVDFLLMNSPSVMMMTIDNNSGLTEKGANTMGAYFAGRIMKGYLKYSEVVAKYPQFKDDIDFILKCEGREDLITQ